MPSVQKLLLAAALAFGMAGSAPADTKEGVRKWQAGDFAGAVAEWRGPAAAGNSDAQFNLGQAYKLGRGVRADPAMAIDFYRKAAARGHEPAEANLGWILFQQGKKREALPMLQRAAGRGDAHSQYLLGVAYFNGDLVPVDQLRAYRLMTAAAASDLPQAREALRQMDSRIPLADRQRALASAEKTVGQAADKPPLRKPSSSAAPVARTAAASPSANAKAVSQPQTGSWRVQLGAFSNPTAAAAAWAGLTGKISSLATLDPIFVNTGEVVRLQAGPIADGPTAGKLCAKITATGAACFPVQP